MIAAFAVRQYGSVLVTMIKDSHETQKDESRSIEADQISQGAKGPKDDSNER